MRLLEEELDEQREGISETKRRGTQKKRGKEK